MKPPEYEPHLPIPEGNQGEAANQLVEKKMPSPLAQNNILVNRHNVDQKNVRPNTAQMYQ